jgi:phosphohistidine phosphatase
VTLGLWILRHGKAASEGPGGDSTRPLTKRGRRQADIVREHLEEVGRTLELPALVISSPAARALETAELVVPAMPNARLDIEAELYSEEASGILEWLRDVRPDEKTVMIVGHNPSLLDLSILLSGPVDRELMVSAGLPTAGLVALSDGNAGEWGELVAGSSKIVHRFVPD